MNWFDRFMSLVTEHDRRYNKKNPYALAHYAGAIQSARGLVADPTSRKEVVSALVLSFEIDFPPLVKLAKESES